MESRYPAHTTNNIKACTVRRKLPVLEIAFLSYKTGLQTIGGPFLAAWPFLFLSVLLSVLTIPEISGALGQLISPLPYTGSFVFGLLLDALTTYPLTYLWLRHHLIEHGDSLYRDDRSRWFFRHTGFRSFMNITLGLNALHYLTSYSLLTVNSYLSLMLTDFVPTPLANIFMPVAMFGALFVLALFLRIVLVVPSAARADRAPQVTLVSAWCLTQGALLPLIGIVLMFEAPLFALNFGHQTMSEYVDGPLTDTTLPILNALLTLPNLFFLYIECIALAEVYSRLVRGTSILLPDDSP